MKCKKSFICFLFITILLCNSAAASSNKVDASTFRDIDDYIKKQMEDFKVPGIAIGIVRDNRIAYLKGYGIAEDNGRKVTPQTPFLIASVSKSFTALAIMQLVEDGKIDLDAPVQRYLPWFHTPDAETSSEITVRNLLNQTSGFSGIEGVKANLDDKTGDDALENFIRGLANVSLVHMPGDKFEYSNINYGILGLIIQKISGQTYEHYIQEKIFDRLDMRHSYLSQTTAGADNAASGYYAFFGFPIAYNIKVNRVSVPGAGIYSSAEDISHYLIAHLNEGRFGDDSILSAEGIAELHRPSVKINDMLNLSYALGWLVAPYRDVTKNAIVHTGGWAGFQSIALLVPEKKLGVVLLSNYNNPAINSVFRSIGWGIAEIYLGGHPSKPTIDEMFIRRHSRFILVSIIVLLCASAYWSLRSLSRWRREDSVNPPRSKRLWGNVIAPAIIDLLLALTILKVLLPMNNITLPVTLYFAPDLGFLIIIILMITIGWGTIRTLLMLGAIFKKRKPLPLTN